MANNAKHLCLKPFKQSPFPLQIKKPTQMKPSFRLLILFSLLTSGSFSQNLYEKALTTDLATKVNSVQFDGNNVWLIGSKGECETPWIAKLNNSGTVTSENTLNSEGAWLSSSMASGKLYLAGKTESNGSVRPTITHVDANGNTVWTYAHPTIGGHFKYVFATNDFIAGVLQNDSVALLDTLGVFIASHHFNVGKINTINSFNNNYYLACDSGIVSTDFLTFSRNIEYNSKSVLRTLRIGSAWYILSNSQLERANTSFLVNNSVAITGSALQMEVNGSRLIVSTKTASNRFRLTSYDNNLVNQASKLVMHSGDVLQTIQAKNNRIVAAGRTGHFAASFVKIYDNDLEGTDLNLDIALSELRVDSFELLSSTCSPSSNRDLKIYYTLKLFNQGVNAINQVALYCRLQVNPAVTCNSARLLLDQNLSLDIFETKELQFTHTVPCQNAGASDPYRFRLCVWAGSLNGIADSKNNNDSLCADQINIRTSLNNLNNTTNSPSIYPNPSKNKIAIKGIKDAFDIYVFDLSGKLILSQNQIHSNQEIAIEHLHSGLYFIQIKSGTKSEFLKFIKD